MRRQQDTRHCWLLAAGADIDKPNSSDYTALFFPAEKGSRGDGAGAAGGRCRRRQGRGGGWTSLPVQHTKATRQWSRRFCRPAPTPTRQTRRQAPAYSGSRQRPLGGGAGAVCCRRRRPHGQSIRIYGLFSSKQRSRGGGASLIKAWPSGRDPCQMARQERKGLTRDAQIERLLFLKSSDQPTGAMFGLAGAQSVSHHAAPCAPGASGRPCRADSSKCASVGHKRAFHSTEQLHRHHLRAVRSPSTLRPTHRACKQRGQWPWGQSRDRIQTLNFGERVAERPRRTCLCSAALQQRRRRRRRRHR